MFVNDTAFIIHIIIIFKTEPKLREKRRKFKKKIGGEVLKRKRKEGFKVFEKKMFCAEHNEDELERARGAA